MNTSISGIFCPVAIPLDDKASIDEAELRRYIDWLIERGVHGIYTNGSAGEFIRFSLEERRRICRIICEQCAGRVPVLAGATENNIREVIESCELYRQFGARAVALLPPIYYKLSQSSLLAYFEEIARLSPIDITLYNIPLFCPAIEVATLQKLALDHRRIIGMKDSSGDIGYMGRVISAIRPRRPEFVVLSGWEAAVVPSMLLGANGGTLGSSGAVPELTRRLYDLCVTKRWDEAVQLQFRLTEFFDAILYGADFPEGLRAAVELRSIRLGASRQPSNTNRDVLKNLLRCIMSDFGLAALPQSCLPRSGGFAGEPVDLSPDLTLDVTSKVMEELKRRGML
jgi:2-dehydro-3-deoxy-D-pentonate aldolase